jgi:hypothetical protein
VVFENGLVSSNTCTKFGISGNRGGFIPLISFGLSTLTISGLRARHCDPSFTNKPQSNCEDALTGGSAAQTGGTSRIVANARRIIMPEKYQVMRLV